MRSHEVKGIEILQLTCEDEGISCDKMHSRLFIRDLSSGDIKHLKEVTISSPLQIWRIGNREATMAYVNTAYVVYRCEGEAGFMLSPANACVSLS